MTGSSPPDGVIGVGSALQKAREHRGLLLEDAARDTKLRTDQLRALEDEDFESLGGEVYARAALRTYAAYLGLSSDKVMTAYLRHADDPEPPPPPRQLGRVERAIAATRIRDNQRFLVIAAAFVVGVLLIFGLLSPALLDWVGQVRARAAFHAAARRSAPPPAPRIRGAACRT